MLQERNFVRSLAESAYPSLAAYLPHLAIPPNPFLPKPDPSHPFFLNPASSFHFSSLFSGDLGRIGHSILQQSMADTDHKLHKWTKSI